MDILKSITNTQLNHNPLAHALVGGIIVSCGVFMSISIVSYFMYDKNMKYNKNIEKKLDETNEEKKARELRVQKIKYGQSFFTELEELKDKELTEDDIKEFATKMIEEKTPEGDILMLYNYQTETFWYYSENKNISNRSLDAVARRYAVKYDCKQLCVNYKKEMENMRNNLKKLFEENKDKKDDEAINRGGDSVFLTAKITKKKIRRQHNRAILNKVNRFTYKGKLSDYKKEIERKKNETELKDKLMTFSDFKKLLDKNKGLERVAEQETKNDIEIVHTPKDDMFVNIDDFIKKKTI